MKRLVISLALWLLVFHLAVSSADAWTRSPAIQFATLPADAAHPEGITADAGGNIYVTTFDPGASTGRLIVFSPSGQLVRDVVVQNASPFLLGLAFHPGTGALLVIDFGQGKVLTVNPFTGASIVFMSVAPPPAAGLNALTFDASGNVYVSDSFGGIIWMTGPSAGAATKFATSPLLQPNGVPPFGANGLAFNREGTTLFVANTANDTVVQIPVSNPDNSSVFVHSINGADGLIIDEDDNLWVAANQADEIVVVNPSGRAIAKLGDFSGLDPKGAPNGLLFPAGLVFSRGFLYVTNLSLDLRVAVAPDVMAVDSQWAAEVKRHTVARISAKIPPVQGLK
jgi:sugar lactone lactonase YvrE